MDYTLSIEEFLDFLDGRGIIITDILLIEEALEELGLDMDTLVFSKASREEDEEDYYE